jgi:cob(I)alamin adenosyltransferase
VTEATPPTEGPVPPPRRRPKSLVLVNTGDGKGKTTAALGVVMRAVAREWAVCVIQFMKSDEWKVGEETIGRRLGVDWWTLGDGFSWDSDDMDRTQAIAHAAWEHTKGVLAAGEHRLVILDEITYPMNWGWISTDEVVEAIRSRPLHVNVIATGRDAPAPLVEVADTVTEMTKIKHAYDTGVVARRGIDF